MSLLDSCVSRLVSPCPFLFCSMSQLFTLCPYLYVCSLPPTHMPIHQILRLTVIKLCFPDSKLYLCMCRVSCNDNLMSYQIIRLTVLSTIKLCFPDSKLYLCMCRVSCNDNLMSYQIIRLTVLSTMLPGLKVVSVYVLCYIFLSVVNVESWPHQILHLTVLSTNRVILLWILRPTVLSTNRVILLWILRPTVLSTIYQVMLVVIIQHNESCDSTSIYCGFYV